MEELRRQIVAGVKVEEKEVEEKEVAEAYNSNLSRYGPPPVSELEAKERIRATLESQKRSEALGKALNELKIKSQVELYLKLRVTTQPCLQSDRQTDEKKMVKVKPS